MCFLDRFFQFRFFCCCLKGQTDKESEITLYKQLKPIFFFMSESFPSKYCVTEGTSVAFGKM